MCDATSFESTIERLDRNGFAVCHRCVPSELLHACRHASSYRSMPTTASASSNDTWRLTSLGRFHRDHFPEEDLVAFDAIEQHVRPLVDGFFSNEVAASVYRSELQLLNAAPHSESQMWHSDHRRRGLTVVIPLSDFTTENGATQILPGSHEYNSSWWAFGHQLLCGEAIGAACVATVTTGGLAEDTKAAGGLLAYDGRAYHRGLGNRTAESRPALVLRYDVDRSQPPPGVGLVGALAHAGLATVLHVSTATAKAAIGAITGRTLNE